MKHPDDQRNYDSGHSSLDSEQAGGANREKRYKGAARRQDVFY